MRLPILPQAAVTADFTSLSREAMSALDASLRAHEDEKWATFYENREKPCPFFVPTPDECLVEWLTSGLTRPGRALDIGCGNARNSIYLARQGYSVDSIDYSPSAVAWAREQVSDAGLSVNLACSSIFDWTPSPGGYDLIYDCGCFHHIAPHRREQYVDLVSGALAAGGAFGLVCFKPEAGSGYSDEDVYERRSLGGGLGYSESRLRAIWSRSLQVSVLRTMREPAPQSGLFGRAFLWALLAHRQ
jgi:SAM-dependent methyltransferase